MPGLGRSLTDELSHGEIQELLGAYALGAVDEPEHVIIEAHLATCESCRAELDDHSRLAENLRRHASRVSPLASVESNGSSKNGAAPHASPSRRWRFPVAMAIAFVLIGGLFARNEIRFNKLGSSTERLELLERAHMATTAPGVVVTTLLTPRREPVLTVVSRSLGGEAYAINGTLPPLPDGQSYQLWRVGSGGTTAAVALGRQPDTAAFSIPPGVTEFLLTAEKAPSPSRPTLPAVASGRITP
jgi:hypothetical protein